MRRIVAVCVSLSCVVGCDGVLEADPSGELGSAARVGQVAPERTAPERAVAEHAAPGRASLERARVSIDPLDPNLGPAVDLHLISSYWPSQGVVGSRVTIMTSFVRAGCGVAGTCSVTIGSHQAPIVDDTYGLEVVVPDGARSGDLCVRLDRRTECVGFTVQLAPVVSSSAPGQVAAGAGDTVLTIDGDGFMDDSELWLDWGPLPTTVESVYRLTAVVPASLLTSPGTRSLFVFSPSIGRCGVLSPTFELLVE